MIHITDQTISGKTTHTNDASPAVRNYWLASGVNQVGTFTHHIFVEAEIDWFWTGA